MGNSPAPPQAAFDVWIKVSGWYSRQMNNLRLLDDGAAVRPAVEPPTPPGAGRYMGRVSDPGTVAELRRVGFLVLPAGTAK